MDRLRIFAVRNKHDIRVISDRYAGIMTAIEPHEKKDSVSHMITIDFFVRPLAAIPLIHIEKKN